MRDMVAHGQTSGSRQITVLSGCSSASRLTRWISVATPMTAHVAKNALFASPQQVARGICKAIEQRRDVAYVPWFWVLIMLLVRSIPSRFFKKMNL